MTDEEAQQLQTVILTLSRFRGLEKLYLILNGDLTSKGRMKILLTLTIRVLLPFSNQQLTNKAIEIDTFRFKLIQIKKELIYLTFLSFAF